jgi:hypothetical protein
MRTRLEALALLLLVTGCAQRDHSPDAPPVSHAPVSYEELLSGSENDDRSCLGKDGKTQVDSAIIASDVAEIVMLVKSADRTPIMSIESHGTTVEVETGRVCAVHSGFGNVFTLRKHNGRWQIVKKTPWIS